MYQTISEYQFRDTFLQSDTYKNNFTYDGLSVLFDYLEQVEQDTGQEIPFDYVSIACEFAEDTAENIQRYYSIEHDADDEGNLADAVRQYLEDNGAFVGETDDSILYIQH